MPKTSRQPTSSYVSAYSSLLGCGCFRRVKNHETRSCRPSRQHGFTLVAFRQAAIRACVLRNVHLKVAEETSGMAEDGGKHRAVYVSRRERRRGQGKDRAKRGKLSHVFVNTATA